MSYCSLQIKMKYVWNKIINYNFFLKFSLRFLLFISYQIVIIHSKKNQKS